jgi:hypothetical protein
LRHRHARPLLAHHVDATTSSLRTGPGSRRSPSVSVRRKLWCKPAIQERRTPQTLPPDDSLDPSRNALGIFSPRISLTNSWCTGKDSNLRTSLGGTDLQSVGFNHSPTCAETAQASAPQRSALSRQPSTGTRKRGMTLQAAQLRKSGVARTHSRTKNHYTSEKSS